MEEMKTAASGEPRPDGREQAVKPRTSKWATWSMVLGIIGIVPVLCLLTVPSLLAIIFGIIALVKISESSGVLAGKGRAIAGIILGGFWTFMILPIAIIAAIAIPNLLTGRISANEANAVASLKTMAVAEAMWRQQDADGNGLKDYWTYDVSCLYRMLRADGLSWCEFISLDLAYADAAPADVNTFGNSRLSQQLSATVLPKYGYVFRAMTFDENGEEYNQNEVNGVKATNLSKFAFVAYPNVYGTSGVNTFIINQEGTFYCNDCGSDAKKIVLQWPGNNPAMITGPSGRQWRVAN